MDDKVESPRLEFEFVFGQGLNCGFEGFVRFVGHFITHTGSRAQRIVTSFQHPVKTL
jgi:hypothetical protein